MNNIEIKTSKKNNVWDLINVNSIYIILVSFFASGLIFGTFSYRSISENLSMGEFSNVFISNQTEFLNAFINYTFVYGLTFLVILFSGFCVFGSLLLYAIPVLCGFEISIKLSYYYTLYNMKGIGYSLLTIIPEFALFMIITIFGINCSIVLNKRLLRLLKDNTGRGVDLKFYLRDYAIFAVGIVLASLINSLSVCLFSSLIQF